MGEGGSIGLMGSRDEAYKFAISNSDMTKVPGLPCKGNSGSNREGMGSGTTCEEGSWRGSASQLNFCISVTIHLWLGVSVYIPHTFNPLLLSSQKIYIKYVLCTSPGKLLSRQSFIMVSA